MSEWYLHWFNWRGVPVRVHWAVLALAAFELALGRPWVRLVGFAFIILVHELGHAVLVKRYGLSVSAIQVHPLGGECIHEATRDQRQNVIIAWGGVLAQAALIAAAFAVMSLWPEMRGPYLSELFSVLTVSNAFMIAFNLIPIRPLDGHTAWQLKHLRSTLVKQVVAKAKPKGVPATRRDEIEALVDDALEQARKATKDRERP